VHPQVQALRSVEQYLNLDKLYVLGTNCVDNGPREGLEKFMQAASSTPGGWLAGRTPQLAGSCHGSPRQSRSSYRSRSSSRSQHGLPHHDQGAGCMTQHAEQPHSLPRPSWLCPARTAAATPDACWLPPPPARPCRHRTSL